MNEKKLDILRFGVLQLEVCATKNCDDAFIEERVNDISPTGISSRWVIRRYIEPVYCQCQQDSDRQHVIMEC